MKTNKKSILLSYEEDADVEFLEEELTKLGFDDFKVLEAIRIIVGLGLRQDIKKYEKVDGIKFGQVETQFKIPEN